MNLSRWKTSCGPLTASSRVAIVLMGAFASACDQPVAPDPISEYQLVFVNAEEGAPGQDIYRMSPDGTARQNLTRLAAVPYPTFTLAVMYRSLSLAPNGRTIAFETNRDGCPGVWGMNLDGSGISKLSIGEYPTTRCNYFALWSPDGSRIAFTTSREGRWSVYVMNADGSNPRNVSSPLDQGSGFNWPSGWSADGRVVFNRPAPDGQSQAYIVNADGTGLGLLFGRTGDHSPEWSPDGSKVAFIRDTESGSSLYVMNADGSSIRRLTTHPGKDVFWAGYFQNDYARWSPDGRRIAFSNLIDGRDELHVINADGTSHVTLTSYGADFNGWAPDGRITFSSKVSGSHELYLIDPGGTGLVNITNTSTSDEMRALWVRR